ncbi:MAG TPA: hypothetical protein VGD31_11905, partial [Sphingobacteriaceae bacterium]
NVTYAFNVFPETISQVHAILRPRRNVDSVTDASYQKSWFHSFHVASGTNFYQDMIREICWLLLRYHPNRIQQYANTQDYQNFHKLFHSATLNPQLPNGALLISWYFIDVLQLI